MLEFPRDTRENTENFYWKYVKPLFPAYKPFWEKFIGYRQGKDNTLAWYGLKSRKRTGGVSKKAYEHYEEMCMCHYSIFCDIAIALMEMKDAKQPAKCLHSLLHWRHFENLYMRLICIYERFSRMWTHASRLLGNKIPKIEQINDTAVQNIAKKRRIWFEEVSAVRNNFAHFARLGSVLFNDKFHVPRSCKKFAKQNRDILWSKISEVSQGDCVDTIEKMRNDLKGLFAWLGPLEMQLITLMEDQLKTSDIFINREGCEAYQRQSSDMLNMTLDMPLSASERAFSGGHFNDATSGSAVQDPLSCNSSCEAGVNDPPDTCANKEQKAKGNKREL